jgi:hypothetical protein
MRAFFESNISWFYFECKTCGERWFSTCCECPRCKKIRKFKVLSEETIEEYFFTMDMMENIHFVFLAGGK